MRNIYNSSTALYLLIHGLVAILIGIIFAYSSVEIFDTIVLIASILMIIFGIISVLLSFRGKVMIKYNILFQGVIMSGIGLFIAFNLQSMTSFIILILGIWAIISGISQIYYGIATKESFKLNKIMIINGLFTVLIGGVLAVYQKIFLDFIGKIVGFGTILFGLVTIIFAILFFIKFKNNRAEQEEEL